MTRPAAARWTSGLQAGWMLIGGVTAVNMLLAAVSFLKDVCFAAFFGTSEMADAVNTAFLLPDAISSNWIAYVVGVAAVPHLSRLWSGGRRQEFARSVSGLAWHSTFALTAIGILLFVFQKPILDWFRMDWSADAGRQLSGMFLLLLPSMLLFAWSAIGGAALQASGAFYIPAIGPVLFNLVSLIVLAVVWVAGVSAGPGGWLYTASIVVGAALAAGVIRLGYRRHAGLSLSKRGERLAELRRSFGLLRPIYKDTAPLLLIYLFVQGLYAAERILGSQGGTGTLAGLNYAYRIAQFPNWVFVTALTAVILPSLSRSAGRSAGAGELAKALKATLAVMVPTAAIFFLFREQIISLLLQHGAFTGESVALTADLLGGYALSVIGQSVSIVCLRYCLANGKLRKPVLIYLFSCLCSLVFDAIMIGRMGPSALGYGALLGWSLNAILMMAMARGKSMNGRGLS